MIRIPHTLIELGGVITEPWLQCARWQVVVDTYECRREISAWFYWLTTLGRRLNPPVPTSKL